MYVECGRFLDVSLCSNVLNVNSVSHRTSQHSFIGIRVKHKHAFCVNGSKWVLQCSVCANVWYVCVCVHSCVRRRKWETCPSCIWPMWFVVNAGMTCWSRGVDLWSVNYNVFSQSQLRWLLVMHWYAGVDHNGCTAATLLRSPPLDDIWVVVIVWRLRGNISRPALWWIVWHNVHSPQHTYMSNSTLVVLSHPISAGIAMSVHYAALC